MLFVLLRHQKFNLYLRELNSGWIWVDLFFVLSGFLISSILFREYKKTGTIEPGSFLIRRGFKIYPVFYVMMFLSFLAEYFLRVSPSIPEFKRWFFELIFVQNYFLGIWNHTWSLGVEEHFYLFLVVVLYLLFSYKSRDMFAYFPHLCIAIFIICLALRLHQSIYVPFKPRTHAYPTHLRLDSPLFGVFIAYFYNFHRERLRSFIHTYRYLLGVLAFIFIIPTFLYPLENFFVHTLGITLLSIAFGLILLFMLFYEKFYPNLESIKGLGFVVAKISDLGTYSYSIYVFHMFVLRYIMIYIPLDSWMGLTVYYILAIGIGILLSIVIEWPFLRLRDRYFPSRA